MKPGMPTIVCICGSGRFREALEEARRDEALKGNIVLAIDCDLRHPAFDLETPTAILALQEDLSKLHMSKIDLASEVLILNVGKYIGPSTQRELDYAQCRGKVIRYWEEP